MTRNDVDDAVYRVRAPQRAARAADDFYALDVFDQRVLHVPEHAGEQRRIDAAPVNEHEQLVGDCGAVEASCRDGISTRVHARDLEVRRQAQYFWDAGVTGPADVLS